MDFPSNSIALIHFIEDSFTLTTSKSINKAENNKESESNLSVSR